MLKCKDGNKRGRGKKLREIWEWRLSSKPEYCEICRQKAKKKNEILDCTQCEFCVPDSLPGNRVFLNVINDCIFGRDFNGRIDLNAFLKIVDIYGEILEFDALDKLELLRKARFISGIEENERNKDKLVIRGNTKTYPDKQHIKTLKGKRR